MLETRISEALTQAGAQDAPAIISPSARPEFGDYQANGCMAAAKKLKTNPCQLAEQVATIVADKLADIAEAVEVAGPGFINIKLKSDWLGAELASWVGDEHLGTPRPATPQTVVVDYSGPNIAKEMHVGHLRSTIIGDSLARVLDFLGHKVIRQNHIGDWGTQFGMLVEHMLNIPGDVHIPDLEQYYIEAKKRFDTDPEFAARSRALIAEMHRLGPNAWKESDAVLRWGQYRFATLQHCWEVYGRLGISFVPEEFRAKWQPRGLDQIPSSLAPPEQTGIVGESFYNADLPNVVAELKAKGLLTESQGAQCVFLDEFKNKDGDPLPVIVQKTDGGYLYATTDLAAIRYRVGERKADRILYVTDSRQMLHFKQIFAVAREAGFAGENVSLEHVPFGMMLGENGQPFKTREGGTVKLMDLLNEAEDKAEQLVAEKNPGISEDKKTEVAHKVGIGAVKYADLAHNRTSDYVFSWDKMLSLDGNTAPYMQYAYARIRSIFRKGESTACTDFTDAKIIIIEPAERALVVKLLQFPEIVETVAEECTPHVLCGYLFELAGAFMGFYENCPVLKADAPTRASRLALCDLTAKTISTGLGLLGIETLEKM